MKVHAVIFGTTKAFLYYAEYLLYIFSSSKALLFVIEDIPGNFPD